MGGYRGVFAGNTYAHIFLKRDINGLEDMCVQIIDNADVSEPTGREAYWIEKLKCYASLGLNVMEISELSKFKGLVSVKDRRVWSDVLEEMMKGPDPKIYFL